MPKLDLAAIEATFGSGYPAPYDEPCLGRSYQRLTQAAGLTQFGVNICRLKPGAWSSQRHWHENEDEFLMMIEGELVLIEDQGETIMRAGDCAAFPAGQRNGHHLVNRSGTDGAFLVVGTRAPKERAHYPDIDLAFHSDSTGRRFTRKDGTSY